MVNKIYWTNLSCMAEAAYCYWQLHADWGGLEEENLVLCSCMCFAHSWECVVHVLFTSENVATDKRVAVELYVRPSVLEMDFILSVEDWGLCSLKKGEALQPYASEELENLFFIFLSAVFYPNNWCPQVEVQETIKKPKHFSHANFCSHKKSPWKGCLSDTKKWQL